MPTKRGCTCTYVSRQDVWFTFSPQCKVRSAVGMLKNTFYYQTLLYPCASVKALAGQLFIQRSFKGGMLCGVSWITTKASCYE